ncbi:LOW QUALITY PROTEIN: zinc finger C2HC domain-containing protein 1A-like [Narcine bancroftii]|uniref:LOW QUALITY PROTEIN: zinc finger C2HC domain-containing protein 1A-like n=1 Tax=Narcine bancroftii TaxID=1343680 RepID=UPI00383125DE
MWMELKLSKVTRGKDGMQSWAEKWQLDFNLDKCERLGPPVSNWRQKHQEFLDTIRNARVATHAMKKGLPLPLPPPPATTPDYIECPYCNRRFNETAVERHINFCRTNVNRKMTARQNPQPEALPSKLKVQMASRRVPDPRGAEAIPSTSQRLPRGPPATSGPSIYPLSSVRQAQQGKLTAAAQAVMGIRADYDSPPTVRAPDTVRVGARGHPPTQTSRHSRM